MKQITEDYVSFEIAQLLKEKGFKEIVQSLWIGEDEHHYISTESIISDDYNSGGTCLYSAPTHQMALKWLREVYKIHVEIYRTACGYLYIISNIPYGTDLYNPEYGGDDENSGQWTTYEKAVEAALLYVLKNLI